MRNVDPYIDIAKRRKLKQKLTVLSKQLEKKKKAVLNNNNRQIGHFALNNIVKRERRAKEKTAALQEQLGTAQNTTRRQQNQITELERQLKTTRDSVNRLKLDIDKMRMKLRLQQKRSSSYKSQAAKCVAAKKELCSKSKMIEQKSKKIETQLFVAERETEAARCKMVQPFQLRDEGVFTPDTRMCVASLIGMEVPAEQIGPVMGEALSLAGVDFSPKDLPSRQSALNIADECQFLVKQMYAKKLRETGSWGINKDGTSRQKKKILTSNLSLPCGEELNLGFKIVARETAQKICETQKGDLEELELVSKFDEDGQEEPFMKTVLSNLTTLMGDRAAIEKKANELLKDWRDEVLGTTDDQEKKNIVHSFTAWRMLYWDFTATHQPALNSNRRHTLAKTSDLDVRVQPVSYTHLTLPTMAVV